MTSNTFNFSFFFLGRGRLRQQQGERGDTLYDDTLLLCELYKNFLH